MGPLSQRLSRAPPPYNFIKLAFLRLALETLADPVDEVILVDAIHYRAASDLVKRFISACYIYVRTSANMQRMVHPFTRAS